MSIERLQAYNDESFNSITEFKKTDALETLHRVEEARAEGMYDKLIRLCYTHEEILEMLGYKGADNEI